MAWRIPKSDGQGVLIGFMTVDLPILKGFETFETFAGEAGIGGIRNRRRIIGTTELLTGLKMIILSEGFSIVISFELGVV